MCDQGVPLPWKVMSSLHLGGDGSLRTQMRAGEGGQGPRDRAGSGAEAKVKAVGVNEITRKECGGKRR
jgi:hypothetical protein